MTRKHRTDEIDSELDADTRWAMHRLGDEDPVQRRPHRDEYSGKRKSTGRSRRASRSLAREHQALQRRDRHTF